MLTSVQEWIATRHRTATDLQRQQFADSVAAIKIAQAILDIEAHEAGLSSKPFVDYPAVQRHDVLHDAAVSLRIRRHVWRRLSQRAVTKALEAGLTEYLSHYLSQARIHAVACYMTGTVANAALETLSGRMPVTAQEYAAAVRDVETPCEPQS